MKGFNEYNFDYLNLKDFNYDIDNYDDSNILGLRTISKTEFHKIIKYIEKSIKEARENK
jgi:exonuclease V gamma subunit